LTYALKKKHAVLENYSCNCGLGVGMVEIGEQSFHSQCIKLIGDYTDTKSPSWLAVGCQKGIKYAGGIF
jgi:hypothetical protein